MCSHQLCSDSSWLKSSKLRRYHLVFTSHVLNFKFLLNKTTKQKYHIPFPQYPGWASATVLVRSSLFIRKPSERAAPNVTSLGKGARKMLRTLGWVTWGCKCKLPKGYTETQNDQIDDYITSSLKHAMGNCASWHFPNSDRMGSGINADVQIMSTSNICSRNQLCPNVRHLSWSSANEFPILMGTSLSHFFLKPRHLKVLTSTALWNAMLHDLRQ